MFKLQSLLHKNARGIKLLAEATHIAICAYCLNGTNDGTPAEALPTISIRTARETFHITIPLDQVDSVCARLYATAETIKTGKRVDASDLTIRVDY